MQSLSSKTVLVIILCQLAAKEVYSQRACTTPENRPGTCVNVDDCPQIADILMNAPKPLPTGVQNYIKRLSCGTVNNKHGLCCMQPVYTTSPQTQSQPVGTGSNVESRIGVPSHRNLGLLPTTGCGPITTNKLAYGEKAILGEFPWMARLRYRTPAGLNYLCGASIISKRYILTAAHCVVKLPTGYSLYSVVVGEQNTETHPDCEDDFCNNDRREVFFEDFIVHESYDRPRFSNDIGIIRLSEDLSFASDYVKPVCLPLTSETLNLNVAKLIVAGWGTTENQTQATDLLKAPLTVVPISDCRTALKLNTATDDQICAKGKGMTDSCKGDSGGPLMFPFERYIQFGIVSAGAKGCGELTESKPGIYVRVQNYMKWILDNMRN